MSGPIMRTMATGGGGGYTYYSVGFTGDDALTRATNPTGVVDGKEGMLSVWFKVSGGDGAHRGLIRNTGGYFVARLNTANKIYIAGDNAGGTGPILEMTSSTAYAAGGGWHHLLAGWNLAATTGYLYVDGVTDLSGGSVFTDDTINYYVTEGADTWAIGAYTDLGLYFWDGLLCEFYFHPAYIAAATALTTFRSSGKPADLGATGTSALVYQNKTYDQWQVNAGVGGDWTVEGTLTDGGADKP